MNGDGFSSVQSIDIFILLLVFRYLDGLLFLSQGIKVSTCSKPQLGGLSEGYIGF